MKLDFNLAPDGYKLKAIEELEIKDFDPQATYIEHLIGRLEDYLPETKNIIAQIKKHRPQIQYLDWQANTFGYLDDSGKASRAEIYLVGDNGRIEFIYIKGKAIDNQIVKWRNLDFYDDSRKKKRGKQRERELRQAAGVATRKLQDSLEDV